MLKNFYIYDQNLYNQKSKNVEYQKNNFGSMEICNVLNNYNSHQKCCF